MIPIKSREFDTKLDQVLKNTFCKNYSVSGSYPYLEEGDTIPMIEICYSDQNFDSKILNIYFKTVEIVGCDRRETSYPWSFNPDGSCDYDHDNVLDWYSNYRKNLPDNIRTYADRILYSNHISLQDIVNIEDAIDMSNMRQVRPGEKYKYYRVTCIYGNVIVYIFVNYCKQHVNLYTSNWYTNIYKFFYYSKNKNYREYLRDIQKYELFGLRDKVNKISRVFSDKDMSQLQSSIKMHIDTSRRLLLDSLLVSIDDPIIRNILIRKIDDKGKIDIGELRRRRLRGIKCVFYEEDYNDFVDIMRLTKKYSIRYRDISECIIKLSKRFNKSISEIIEMLNVNMLWIEPQKNKFVVKDKDTGYVIDEFDTIGNARQFVYSGKNVENPDKTFEGIFFP